jgi:hypothetical protein
MEPRSGTASCTPSSLPILERAGGLTGGQCEHVASAAVGAISDHGRGVVGKAHARSMNCSRVIRLTCPMCSTCTRTPTMVLVRNDEQLNASKDPRSRSAEITKLRAFDNMGAGQPLCGTGSRSSIGPTMHCDPAEIAPVAEKKLNRPVDDRRVRFLGVSMEAQWRRSAQGSFRPSLEWN